MKKKLTIGIIVGFVCLIFGLILAGIGFFSGGLNELETVAKPRLVKQTFDDVTAIHLKGVGKNIRIKESSDSRVHVSYYKMTNRIQPSVALKQDKGLLRISRDSQKMFQIKGILQLLGEILASRHLDVSTIEVQLPKGQKLQKLSGVGFAGELSLTNVTVSEIDVNHQGALRLENATVEKGEIRTSFLTVTKSILKNTIMTGDYANLNFTEVTLDNTRIKDYHSVEAQKLTVKGHVTMISKDDLSVTNIDLTTKALETTALDVELAIDRKGFANHLLYDFENSKDLERLFREDANLKEQFQNVGIFTVDHYKSLPITKTETQQKIKLDKAKDSPQLQIRSRNSTINFRSKDINDD